MSAWPIECSIIFLWFERIKVSNQVLTLIYYCLLLLLYSYALYIYIYPYRITYRITCRITYRITYIYGISVYIYIIIYIVYQYMYIYGISVRVKTGYHKNWYEKKSPELLFPISPVWGFGDLALANFGAILASRHRNLWDSCGRCGLLISSFYRPHVFWGT